MEEDKQVVENSASNTEKFKLESEVTVLTEDDLEQVSGGTDNKPGTAKVDGVQKDRLTTAKKQAGQIKGLL